MINHNKYQIDKLHHYSAFNFTIPLISYVTLSSNQKQQQSYANITANTTSLATPENSILKFLDNFKGIINPLLLLLTTI
jgi:hypothetical protein